MSYRNKVIAAALLSLSTLAPAGFASAADLPYKAKPVPDVPFFLVIDNRVTYSYIFTGTDPGAFSRRPDGSIDGKTAKSVYSFTHFDVWAYGTNFFTMSLYKSDHNDPASPCTNAGVLRWRLRMVRSVPEHIRLERDLQHQGLHDGATA
jgi:hypothetical protein